MSSYRSSALNSAIYVLLRYIKLTQNPSGDSGAPRDLPEAHLLISWLSSLPLGPLLPPSSAPAIPSFLHLHLPISRVSAEMTLLSPPSWVSSLSVKPTTSLLLV